MPIGITASVDILLIALIALSITMSAIVVSKIISSQTVPMYNMNTDSTLVPAQSAEQSEELEKLREAAPPDGEASYGGGSSTFSPPINDGQLGSGSALTSQSDLASSVYSPVYESAHYILPITWGAVAGTLIWRGKVRSSWCKQGYDYETFRLVARTKGSPTRVKLLNSVATAKNRLQLANELDVDWKTVDNHMEILTRSGLVAEKAIVGTTKYYVLTEHGRRILVLLADGHGSEAKGRDTAIGALSTLNAAG